MINAALQCFQIGQECEVTPDTIRLDPTPARNQASPGRVGAIHLKNWEYHRGNGEQGMRKRSTRVRSSNFVALLLLAGFSQISYAQSSDSKWVGTWAASPMQCGPRHPLAGQTLRQIVHTSIGGSSVRIHLSNLFGTAPLTIDDVRIALWSADSSIVNGSEHKISFDRGNSVTIPPAGEAVSDSVRFRLSGLANVAISMHVVEASGTATCHQSGFQTNYFADGDVSGSTSLPNPKTTKSYFYLPNVDVENRKARGALVALGASITDGYNSTSDANLRWPNDLAQRLTKAGVAIGVLNQGISGNRLLVEGAGDSAETRFGRDVLAQAGVRWVILSDEPINDLGSTKPQPTADQLIAGFQHLIAQAHAKHVKFLCSTLTPYEGANYWNASGEAAREQINSFIRSKDSGCDAVVDQDMATHDPEHPSRYLPAYDSGDHLHPNNAGLQAIADSVPIDSLAR
jgi:lysophospholipase L1-like esterase